METGQVEHTRLDRSGCNPPVQRSINALEPLTTRENLQLVMGLQEDGLRSHSADGRTASSLIVGGAMQQPLSRGVLGAQSSQDPLLVNGRQLTIGSPLEAGVVVTDGIHVSNL